MEKIILILITIYAIWVVLYFVREYRCRTRIKTDNNTEEVAEKIYHDIMGKRATPVHIEAISAEVEKASESMNTFATSENGQPSSADDEQEANDDDQYNISVPLENEDRSAKEAELMRELEDENYELLQEGAELASGICFDDLANAYNILKKGTPTQQDMYEAGRMYSEIEHNDLYDKMMAMDAQIESVVVASIAYYSNRRNEDEMTASEEKEKTQEEDEELKNFDVMEFF